jgi:excisionase family DNA binding protein
MDGKPLLTIPEVARILGASEERTYQMAARGVFPVIRLSPRRIRVPRDSFEAWLRAKTTGPSIMAGRGAQR